MLTLTISAWGLIAPESLVAFVASWPSDTRLYVAAGTRLVIGLIFIAGASKCRLPAVVYGVGICRWRLRESRGPRTGESAFHSDATESY